MIERHIAPLLQESLANFPVVLLVGARQVGKSTLVQTLTSPDWPARYFTLDDRAVLDAALVDPDGFVRSIKTPAIIDEVQRAPDLLRAIKLVVDRDRQPGMFLLTGSANVLTLAKVSETLAGRVAVHELQPFTWSERSELPAPETIERLFEVNSVGELQEMWPCSIPPELGDELSELLVLGGFPPLIKIKTPRARRTWFESYRQTYLERDLRDLANIVLLPEFSRLTRVVAARSGQVLNVSSLSRETGIPNTTLRRYLDLMVQTFLIFLVHPYAGAPSKGLVKTPKIYVSDTGMACHLSSIDRFRTLQRQERLGAMFETWMAGEIARALTLDPTLTTLSYWRTRSGREVDFLVERGREVVGIEVKWASGVKERDLAGLKACREALRKRFRIGVLLYGGTEVIPLDDTLVAVPHGVFTGRVARRPAPRPSQRG